MQAGIIGTFGSMGAATIDADDVESKTWERSEGDHSLTAALEVTERTTTLEGAERVSGKALMERLEEDAETFSVDSDGEIHRGIEERVVQEFTTWTCVPGEVAVVGSSAGTFAFSLLSDMLPATVERGKVDLKAFVEAGGVDPSALAQTGYHDMGPGGSRAYVNAVDGDQAELWEAIHNDRVNQVRASVSARSAGLVDAYVAESGYVAVEDPSDLTTNAYLQFLEDAILPHTEGR